MTSAAEPSIERTTLGTEFDREGIYGLLASDRPDAQVERLWGGANCASADRRRYGTSGLRHRLIMGDCWIRVG